MFRTLLCSSSGSQIVLYSIWSIGKKKILKIVVELHMFYNKSELNFKNLGNQPVGIIFGTAEDMLSYTTHPMNISRSVSYYNTCSRINSTRLCYHMAQTLTSLIGSRMNYS